MKLKERLRVRSQHLTEDHLAADGGAGCFRRAPSGLLWQSAKLEAESAA
jgi:hypothetical protein